MIIKLEKSTEENVLALGGKGCGLVRLLNAGFQVPEAWCIPASVYAGNGGGLSFELKESLHRFWGEFSEKNEGALLAVRSSATMEDLEASSAAGVFLTTLGVDSPKKLLEAVEKCFESLNSEAAKRYREAKGFEGQGSIAVILQRMVPSEVSGVLLTANPLRAFANEYVLDAAYGLGEAVVSGRTQPDHIILDRNTLTIRQEIVGKKQIRLSYNGNGVEAEDVPENLRTQRCLSDEQLQQLGAFAKQVEERIGPRQDCEWAFEGGQLYLLQQRPITGLPPAQPKEIYSRKFADEFLSEYVVPLAMPFVEWSNNANFAEIAAIIGRKDLAANPPIRLYNGYTYFSGAWAADYLIAYPKFFRNPGRIMPDWFTPVWFEGVMKKPFKPLYLLRVIIGPNKDKHRGPPDKNATALAAHGAKLDQVIRPKFEMDLAKLSDDELWQWFDEMYDFGMEHFRLIRWTMANHMIVFHGVLQFLLQRWAKDEDKSLYMQIVSGLPETRTAEINRDVFQLSLLARKDGDLKEKITQKMSYEDLRKSSNSPEFWTAFDRFIANHGHRGTSRSIYDPRWREQPGLVIGFVRAQLHGEKPPTDPVVMEKESTHRRQEAEKEALEKVGRGLFGGIRKNILKTIARRAQQFTVLRENQRYHLDVILFQERLLALESGRRMVERGLLANPLDVFFFSVAELRDMFVRGGDAKQLGELVKERREHYEKWNNRVPATYLFDEVETEGDAVEGDPAPGELSGEAGSSLGVSRGVYQGRVRVVTEMEHLDDIEHGEILVTENIDPAWTGVYPMLGGLVTELGGVLAHGALLAREYGLPAVMLVPHATETYKTGDWIEIDGSTGSVHLVEPPI